MMGNCAILRLLPGCLHSPTATKLSQQEVQDKEKEMVSLQQMVDLQSSLLKDLWEQVCAGFRRDWMIHWD